jgi:hypothetical protein
MYLKKGYYINESLSKGRSSLFYKARQLKKQKLILDTWTRDGLEWTWTSVTITALLDLWAGSSSFGFGFCPVLNGLGTEVFRANVIGNWLSRRFINYRLKNTYMLIECTLKRVIILMNHYPKEDLVYSIMLDNWRNKS